MMKLDSTLYREHSGDLLLRALRADPTFHACPQCAGGGFTTESCLQERELKREQAMISQHEQAGYASIFLWVVMFARPAGQLIMLIKLGRGGRKTPGMRGMLFWLSIAGVAELLLRLIMARLRRTSTKPHLVGCPECNFKFAMQAETQTETENFKTKRWLAQHCRQCPGCQAPIQKEGGCNHMNCGKCKLNFCWACMQASWRCGPYRCHNGAPNGDASPPSRTPGAHDPWYIGALRRLQMVAFFSCSLEAVVRQPAGPLLASLARKLVIVAWFFAVRVAPILVRMIELLIFIVRRHRR